MAVEPVDWEGLSENCAGDEGLILEVVELFEREEPMLLEAVKEAVRAADAEGIKRTAHRLKGALVSLSATAAVEHARDLERAGADHSLAGTDEMATRLSSELDKVMVYLRARRSAAAA